MDHTLDSATSIKSFRLNVPYHGPMRHCQTRQACRTHILTRRIQPNMTNKREMEQQGNVERETDMRNCKQLIKCRYNGVNKNGTNTVAYT